MTTRSKTIWGILLAVTMICLLIIASKLFATFKQESLNREYIQAILDRNKSGVIAALHSGANPNASLNIMNSTPFWKIFSRHTSVDKTLSPKAILVAFGWRSQAAKYPEKQYFDPSIVRIIVEHGGNIDARDRLGETPLLLSARYFDDMTFKYLVDHGANTAISDNMEETAWRLSFFHQARLRLLLSHGQDVNATDVNGRTALISNSGADSLANVKLLLEHHASVNYRDFDRHTALYFAQESRRLLIGKDLSAWEASFPVQGRDIKLKRCNEIIRILKQAGGVL